MMNICFLKAAKGQKRVNLTKLNSILILSDSERIFDFFYRLRHQIEDEIYKANDLIQGLKIIFEKRPRIVFIQDKLSGLSAEEIATHIKKLLQHQFPRIVLLRNSVEEKLCPQSSIDESIVLTLPENELTIEFQRQFQDLPISKMGELESDNAESGAGKTVAVPSSCLSSTSLNFSSKRFAKCKQRCERYLVLDQFYFRIFREKGIVRAIEVIAFEYKAITETYLTAFLSKLSKKSFIIQSIEEKNGYRIEQGNLGLNIEVIIYKIMKNNNIKAFTIFSTLEE